MLQAAAEKSSPIVLQQPTINNKKERTFPHQSQYTPAIVIKLRRLVVVLLILLFLPVQLRKKVRSSHVLQFSRVESSYLLLSGRHAHQSTVH